MGGGGRRPEAAEPAMVAEAAGTPVAGRGRGTGRRKLREREEKEGETSGVRKQKKGIEPKSTQPNQRRKAATGKEQSKKPNKARTRRKKKIAENRGPTDQQKIKNPRKQEHRITKQPRKGTRREEEKRKNKRIKNQTKQEHRATNQPRKVTAARETQQSKKTASGTNQEKPQNERRKPRRPKQAQVKKVK